MSSHFRRANCGRPRLQDLQTSRILQHHRFTTWSLEVKRCRPWRTASAVLGKIAIDALWQKDGSIFPRTDDIPDRFLVPVPIMEFSMLARQVDEAIGPKRSAVRHGRASDIRIDVVQG